MVSFKRCAFKRSASNQKANFDNFGNFGNKEFLNGFLPQGGIPNWIVPIDCQR